MWDCLLMSMWSTEWLIVLLDRWQKRWLKKTKSGHELSYSMSHHMRHTHSKPLWFNKTYKCGVLYINRSCLTNQRSQGRGVLIITSFGCINKGGGGNWFPERRSVFWVDGGIEKAHVSHTFTVSVKAISALRELRVLLNTLGRCWGWFCPHTSVCNRGKE